MTMSGNQRNSRFSNSIFASFLILILSAVGSAQAAKKMQALQDMWLFTRIQAVAPNGRVKDVTKEVIEQLAEVAGPATELRPGFTFQPLHGLDPAIVRPDGTKRDSVNVVAGIMATTMDAAKLDLPDNGIRMTLVVIASADKDATHVSPGDNLFLKLFNLAPLKDADSALIDYVFGQSLPDDAGQPEADDAVSLLRARMLGGRFRLGAPPEGVTGDLAVLANMRMKRVGDRRLPSPAPTIWRKTANPVTHSAVPTAAASFINTQLVVQVDVGGGVMPAKARDLVAKEIALPITCTIVGAVVGGVAGKSPGGAAAGAAAFAALCAYLVYDSVSGKSPLGTLWDRNVPPPQACVTERPNTQIAAVFVKARFEPAEVNKVNDHNEKGLALSGGECARSAGDPHLTTHDGLRYSFQGVGEFVLSKTDDFEVQARLIPWGKTISMNGAVAARFGEDRVALYPGKPIRFTINGVETAPLEPGEAIYMPGGLQIERYRNWYRFARDGFVVEADPGTVRIGTIYVRVPEGSKVVGLLGNRDGDPKNDIGLPNGEVLTRPVEFDDLYGRFGNAWRVTMKTSLFDYNEGETAETFADKSLPTQKVSVRDFSAAARRSAEDICRKEGVTVDIDLENCIFDVAATGDETFAQDATGGREPSEILVIKDKTEVARGSTADGVTLEIPSVLMASYPVEVKITGPIRGEGHQLRTIPAGGGPRARATNPGSSFNLSGGERSITLAAPYPPGDYELVYLSPGGRNILLSVPFRVIAPKAEIFAPDTAEVGTTVEVRVVGDISPSTKINIVPVGSPISLVGDHVFLKEGTGATVRIVLRHAKKPGSYEIQYVTLTSHVVYARRPLTIK